MLSLSTVLAQAILYLSSDPFLVWNYGVVAVISAIGGILFWLLNRQLDRKKDVLNRIPCSIILPSGGKWL